MSSHNNNSVSGPKCSYVSLSNYNSGSKGMSPPVSTEHVQGVNIVPGYSAPGYNTLQHDSCSCVGYPDIGHAYRNQGGSCGTKFHKRVCQ